jgi:hypothetical protein
MSLSLYSFPFLLSVHIVGLAVVVGIFMMRDLRLIGFFQELDLVAFLSLATARQPARRQYQYQSFHKLPGTVLPADLGFRDHRGPSRRVYCLRGSHAGITSLFR